MVEYLAIVELEEPLADDFMFLSLYSKLMKRGKTVNLLLMVLPGKWNSL